MAGAGEDRRLKIHHLESKILQTPIRHLFFLLPPSPTRGAGWGPVKSAVSEVTPSMASINGVTESRGAASTVSAADSVPMNRPPVCPYTSRHYLASLNPG